MQFLRLLLLPVLALTAAAAAPRRACQKAIFVLSGDSTTAPQSAGGGGWGNGFKNTTLLAPSFAENHAVNGRSTQSVLANGEWAGVLDAVTKYKSQGSVYVTIQFGHNDQKLVNFTGQFEVNLKRMVGDVKTAGGVPILVTPLARRTYTDGVLTDKLADWATITLSVAKQTKTHKIDLLKESMRYLTAIGEANARKFDLVADDRTHLNDAGSVVFGRMVSDLLVAEMGEPVRCVTKADKELSKKIKDGVMAI